MLSCELNIADCHQLDAEAEACRRHLNNLRRRAVEAAGTTSITLNDLQRLNACLDELRLRHSIAAINRIG